MRPHQQNNQSKTNWRCDRSNKAPALEAQNPDYIPQSHQKKKEMSNTPTYHFLPMEFTKISNTPHYQGEKVVPHTILIAV
jgi:hypothetical protein